MPSEESTSHLYRDSSMLVGYVSDERYVAISDCMLLFENGDYALDARSSANGAVYADLQPGTYDVALNRDGFGPKRVRVEVQPDRPRQFRLLSNGLLGYAWPKCVRSGEQAEFRVHSTEAYKLSLWRYGYNKELASKIGWFDEHGPGATVQITPDGDYTQSGVQWTRFGYTNPHHKQSLQLPDPYKLTYTLRNARS